MAPEQSYLLHRCEASTLTVCPARALIFQCCLNFDVFAVKRSRGARWETSTYGTAAKTDDPDSSPSRALRADTMQRSLAGMARRGYWCLCASIFPHWTNSSQEVSHVPTYAKTEHMIVSARYASGPRFAGPR